jgi:hypothetical protein
MQIGIVNSTILCHSPYGITHKSIWELGNPLTSPTPLLLLQVSMITVVIQFFDACLKPLGQTSLVSQILVSSFQTLYIFIFDGLINFNDHHNINGYLWITYVNTDTRHNTETSTPEENKIFICNYSICIVLDTWYAYLYRVGHLIRLQCEIYSYLISYIDSILRMN